MDISSDFDFISMAHTVRFLSLDAVEYARSGHPGLPMGMAEVATVLFTRFLKFDATKPDWPDRDRLILSAGHGSMLLYALFYLTGVVHIDQQALKSFRQYRSLTPGHPERNVTPGVEITTGPLGQGFANAVGIALGERLLRARFGDALVNHRTYVIASDGDLMEGITHEAASLAGHLGLGQLIVLWDDNHVSIDGSTDLTVSEDTLKRFQAYGWSTYSVDGHDVAGVIEVLERAQQEDRPSFIACRTIIGYGAPTVSGTEKCHGNPLGSVEVEKTRQNLGWSYAPFEVPEAVLKMWREVGVLGRPTRLAWERYVQGLPSELYTAFTQTLKQVLPVGWRERLLSFKQRTVAQTTRVSTRKASQGVLEELTAHIPYLIGGAGDLTGSTCTRTSVMSPISRDSFEGRYLFYGVREFAMAAMMNGLAVHGGFIPYGGTFVVFVDYMRSAMRLSALMGLHVIYVLSHDSIAVGEDGPTHQPVEHLALLRATPNLTVYRPADAVETAECWELALAHQQGPSALILTRQEVARVRTIHNTDPINRCANGGYILKEASGTRKVTLIASGSEVQIIQQASTLLEHDGIPTAVVSLPSWEIFEQQSEDFRREVLGENVLRVSVEAGSPLGWERYVGSDGIIIALQDYGLSAPGQQVLEHFGFTPQRVVQAVKERVSPNSL